MTSHRDKKIGARVIRSTRAGDSDTTLFPKFRPRAGMAPPGQRNQRGGHADFATNPNRKGPTS